MLNESVRTDMKTVDISLSSEVFLCRLFGKSMAYVHGKQTEKKWRKIVSRLFVALRKSIETNIHTNGFHKWRLYIYIEQLEETLSSEHNIDPELILTLAGIVFELLGGLPDYTGRYRINKKDDYKLNEFRNICYLQTSYQKVCTIWEASRYEPYSSRHTHTDLFQEYVTNFNGDPDGFLTWYKSTYADVYTQIF